MGSLKRFLKVLQPPALRISYKVNPRLFPFDVEALLVECALNTFKSMPACPRNNLKYLAIVETLLVYEGRHIVVLTELLGLYFL